MFKQTPSLLHECNKMGYLIVALIALLFCRIPCQAYPAKALSAYGMPSPATPLARWYAGRNRGRDASQIVTSESGVALSQSGMLSTRNSGSRSVKKRARISVARFLGMICFLAVIVAFAAKQYPSEFYSVVSAVQRSPWLLRLKEYVTGGEGGDDGTLVTEPSLRLMGDGVRKGTSDAGVSQGMRTVGTQTFPTFQQGEDPESFEVVDVDESPEDIEMDEDIADVLVAPEDLFFEDGTAESIVKDVREEKPEEVVEPELSESEQLDAEMQVFLNNVHGTGPVPPGVDAALWSALNSFNDPVRLPKPSMTKGRTKERLKRRLEKMLSDEGRHLAVLRRCRWYWSKMMHVLEVVMSLVCNLTDLIELQKRVILTLNALSQEENLDKFVDVYYGRGEIPEGLVAVKARKASQQRLAKEVKAKLLELSPQQGT